MKEGTGEQEGGVERRLRRGVRIEMRNGVVVVLGKGMVLLKRVEDNRAVVEDLGTTSVEFVTPCIAMRLIQFVMVHFIGSYRTTQTELSYVWEFRGG